MGNALPTISGFVSPISADIADSHAATADCQADCQIASTSTRSVIRAGHSSPYCQRFEADNSHETELFSPLPNRDIALPVTDSHRPASHGLEPATPERQTRALMGGKGLFLHRMQQARIPVPPFTVVDTTLVAKLEQQPFPAQCLLPLSARYTPLEPRITQPGTIAQDRYRTPPSATGTMAQGIIRIYCQ